MESSIERYLPAGGSVLDAGCGSGVLSFVASQRAGSVVAFDGSEEMIRIARRKIAPSNSGNVSIAVAPLTEICSFGTGSFDLVISSSVLEYVDDIDAALRAHAEMLKKDGILLVSMPNGESLYRWLEGGVFRISNHPRYRRCVYHVPRAAMFEQRLRRASLEPLETVTFAAVPVLGRVLRAVGLGSRSDMMFLTAAGRTNAREARAIGAVN